MIDTTLETSPISLTAGALKEVRRLLSDTEIPEGHLLRVGVRGGGCSGLSYILGFDMPGEHDAKYRYEDLIIVMDPAHTMYLAGMEVDYQDGLQNRGFVFNNPNASETCGCGTSFTA